MAGAELVIPAAATKPAGGAVRQRAATAPSRRLRRSARSIRPRSASSRGHRSRISREPVQRRLPVERQIGQVGGEVAKPRWLDPLDQQLVERPGEVLRQPEGLRRVDVRHMLLDEPGEKEQPFERLDRGRKPLPLPQRLERPADPLVQLRIADRNEAGKQQAAARAPDEGVRERPGGAVVGDQDDALGKARVAAPEASDQPRRQRVGERAVRRDGENGDGVTRRQRRRLEPASAGRTREPPVTSPGST